MSTQTMTATNLSSPGYANGGAGSPWHPHYLPGGTLTASPAIVIGPIANPGGGFAAYEVSSRATVKTAFPLYDIKDIDDPLVGNQWHLTRLGDLNAVWQDYTGKDVHVGVYDSGIQYAHWDLGANYDASREVVINGVKFDGDYRPATETSEASGPHGTSVAGLIAAARNGQGGVGVAYDAKLTGVNIFDPSSPIFVNGKDSKSFFEAVRQSDRYDVTNHSWGGRGPIITAASRTTPGSFGYEMVSALSNGTDHGRGGLGTIHVAAAGNDITDGQTDAWKTDRHVVAVGAYRESDGNASYYTSSGAHLLVSAPSNDYAVLGGTGQVTTDLLGTNGYNTVAAPKDASDYTDGFGGTSGATPVVTGVVSLMLDANKALGWRDVRDILAYSAKLPVAFETGQTAVTYKGKDLYLNNSHFQMAGQDANWNGGAAHYSRDYGYGAVDAYNAVRMAEVWSLFGPAKTSANEASVSTGPIAVNMSMADTGSNTPSSLFSDFIGTPKSFTFDVSDAIDVEHLDLTVNFKVTAAYEGKDYDWSMYGTKLKLIAPDGTSGFIDTYFTADDAISGIFSLVDGAQTFTFGLAGFRGVDMLGTWTLQFEQPNDFMFDGMLTINSIKLDAYGSAVSNDNVYTYTNEFFTMAAINGEAGRKMLVDSNGGTDWINAAAVSKDVVVSLVGGQSSSFGGEKAFTIDRGSVIENAVTGDGNDTLIGNRYNNALYGMRGNDVLNGGMGDDLLSGGTGSNRFVFDAKSGHDTIVDWARSDIIQTVKALKGVGSDGVLTVGANATLLLDGTANGNTVLLADASGAKLQALGQKDGYYWYAYVADAAANAGKVVQEFASSPAAAAMSAVDHIVASATDNGAANDNPALFGAHDAGASAHAVDTGFFLYDAMAGSMDGGVQLFA